MIKINSGKYRGKQLKTLDNLNTRPTKDQVKLAIFNHLYDVSKLDVLDLFSGSGNLAFEALSRGANSIYLNDNSYQAYQIMKENSQFFEGDIHLYNLDYKNALEEFKELKFDLILLDPPYFFKDLPFVFKTIDDYAMLKENGIIVLEDSCQNSFNTNLFNLYKQKKYGVTMISYFRCKND